MHELKLSPLDKLSTEPLGPKGLHEQVDGDVLLRLMKESSRDFNTYSEAILPEKTPISNQGGIGSCVANAMCDGLEILQGIHGDEVQQLSRLSLYYWSRCLHRGQHQDEGTYIHTAAQQLKTMGVLLEQDWPYIEANVNKGPPNHLIIAASDNRLEGAIPLRKRDGVLDECESLIRAGCPILFSTQITREDFQDPSPGKVLDVPVGAIWGGHAILCTGVRITLQGARQFLIRNSWGSGWGDNGHIWVTDRYVDRSVTGFVALTLTPGLVV